MTRSERDSRAPPIYEAYLGIPLSMYFNPLQSSARLKQNAFYSIWNDTEPNIHVLEFPKVIEALIEKYRRKAPDYGLDREQ